ncbi:MAG: LysR substrate-binding domain-containing protein [Gammaproteobacteria bacterium]|nr:LysR substrate-binding domain-containing protein [Gammaproteobacteria bacterium]
MQKLRRRIPNLTALAFFESAGRHMSFSRAAAELKVTQGAVSRQIRLLEEALGAALFHRHHRAVELTPAGERFHRAVTIGLGHVQAATEEIAGVLAANELTVAATHAVASLWLMPRMPRLQAEFPELDIHVLATDAELEELGDRFDIGIRYGSGSWPGYRSVRLGTCEVFPVCSPAFMARCGELDSPADLLRQPLLHQDDQHPDWLDWPGWLAEQGVPGPYPRPALRASSHPLLMQAARNGQGIALGWSHLAGDSLRAGDLVVPLDARIVTRQGVYLAMPRNREAGARLEEIVEWLVAEFRSEQGGLRS